MASRLMIAAGAAPGAAAELPFGVRALIEEADEILVVTPVLPGRFEWLASATDRAREQADARLRAVLGELEEVEPRRRGSSVATTRSTRSPTACASSHPTTC
jgi:hypothetical protein